MHATTPPSATRHAWFANLCRRLHTTIRRRYLKALQRDLRAQLALIQGEIDEATRTAIVTAALHRYDAALQQLRQGLRAERDTLQARLQIVGRELDDLEQRQ